MSAVSLFNKCMIEFTDKLGNVMTNDHDLNAFKEYTEFVHINARMFITPFQQYIAGDVRYVHNILKTNMAFFETHDFARDDCLRQLGDKYNDKKDRLILKLKKILCSAPKEESKMIFDSMKLLIYYALLDQYRNESDPTNMVQIYMEMCIKNADLSKPNIVEKDAFNQNKYVI